MEYAIYKYCAIIGCTLVGIQLVLQVFGVFGDTDVDTGHEAAGDVHGDVAGHGNVFFGVLSLKAMTAFAGIFGLVGLVMTKQDAGQLTRLAVSVGSGVAGMLAVGWMMRGLSRLQSSGNLDVRNAVGRAGIVYLRIPGANAGRGKVTLQLQGRSLELPAVTDGETIETGTRVTVESVGGDETVKVVRA